MVIATIILLLLVRRPPAIARLVITILVDSIECHTFHPVEPFTHVRQEILECVPSLTNDNSPIAIVSSLRIGLRVTTPHHRPPRSVCSALQTINAVAMPHIHAMIVTMVTLHET